MSDFTYLVIGLLFGIIIMLNRKDYQEQKTREQVDAELREELEVNKNLVKSLTEDLHWAKEQIRFYKEKQ
jgi:hypothetical protein